MKKWRWSGPYARRLVRDSLPLIAAGLAVVVYMRIDQLMLGSLKNQASVGIYSAALRISEILYFAPVALAGSAFPTLLALKATGTTLYTDKFLQFLKALSLLATCTAVVISLGASRIIHLLYGESYSQAATVLTIHVWTSIFVYLGVGGGRWLIAANLQIFTLYRTILGALLSVILNAILIPQYGVIGSAWASVASQSVACVFANAASAKTRPLFWMQCKAIAWPLIAPLWLLQTVFRWLKGAR